MCLQGVMGCPECKNKLQVTISADDVSCSMNFLILQCYDMVCGYKNEFFV